MTRPPRLRLAHLALLASTTLALSSRSAAATWADERTTPRLRDLVVVDQTGEPGWLFGPEDVLGDGLERFDAPERALDLRSAYAALDDGRLWLRAYVSSEQAPDPELRVYFFLDADADPDTGGSARAPEIAPVFAQEDARLGYDFVIGLQSGSAIAGVWQWSRQRELYEPAPEPPLAASAESGTDLDPLRLFAETHGYVQGALDARPLGIAPSCDMSLLVRSARGDAAGDADVGGVAPCRPADADRNGVLDLIEVTRPDSCERDEQCPASGLCLGGRCLYPSQCRADADCAGDERCSEQDICEARGGGECSAQQSCSGGLVCVGASECRACDSDGQCGAGGRCAASGRCVDESSRSGSAGGASEDEVVLGPGEEVQGGAGTCSAAPAVGARAARGLGLGLLALAALALGRRRRWALGAALLSLLASPALRAQVDGERLKPAVTHDGWVNAEGSAVRHPDDPWELGASLSYAHNPLIIASGDDALVDALVAGRLGFDLYGSVSFGERFALGLGLPLFAQHGDFSPSSFGLGDLRLVPKLALTDDVEDGIGLALAAELRAPTHSGDFAGGARSLTFVPKVIADHRFASGLRVGANLGVLLREDSDFLNVSSSDELTYAAAVGYRFGGHSGGTELGVELSGGVNLSEPGDEEVALEALGFLRQALSPEWQLKGGAGAGVLAGYGVPTWRVFLGVTFSPTSHDRDYDGVPDSADQCPDFAEDRDGVQDEDGCPEEDTDSDQDGVSDDDDDCPTEKETINGIDDDDGCPDSGDRRVLFDDGELTILDTIRFETGSAAIHPSAHSLLDQVALTLRANPEIRHVRIEGHTDDTGPRDVNMALAQRRALSVKHYLVRRGVSPRRLTLRSHGPDRPREAGTDARARARNRRVEFIVE